MSFLLLFIDGIGIGEFDAEINPFARFPTPFFPAFRQRQDAAVRFGGVITATDVSMGVAGLPQSATGQTALFTGQNAARVLGRHHSGFPTASLRELLAQHSIFLKLEKMHKSATFANAFTPEYFRRSERLISASTWSVRAAGFPFRLVDPDLLQGRAISHDLTNKFLTGLGYDVPLREPEEAARILASILPEVDFCLFEYFMTDLIGHSQEMNWAGEELQRLCRFLETLLAAIDLETHTVLLTSDHGNFEDLSVPTHTNHPVPTTIWGPGHRRLAEKISKIEDISPAILAFLQSAQ